MALTCLHQPQMAYPAVLSSAELMMMRQPQKHSQQAMDILASTFWAHANKQQDHQRDSLSSLLSCLK